MKSVAALVAILLHLATLSTFCTAHKYHHYYRGKVPFPWVSKPKTSPAPAPAPAPVPAPAPAPAPAPPPVPEILNATFVEGLQAGEPVMAPQLDAPEDCSEFCLETEECIAWSHNSNDGQCRVFKCINGLQPNNPDYVTGIFDDVSCS